MDYLNLKADIALQKINEFNQSKLAFINKLPQIDGYSGFTEKTSRQFNIKIGWTSRESLNNFMESDLFKVFHGALITLSSFNSIDIISE